MKTIDRLVRLFLATAVAACSIPGPLRAADELRGVASLSPQEQTVLLNRFFDRAVLRTGDGAAAAPKADSLFRQAVFAQPGAKERMLRELDFIDAAFKAGYAPFAWKEQHLGWDFDAEVAKARAAIEAKPDMTFGEYHQLLQKLAFSARDYHVGIHFASSEAASLPFAVQAVGGKFFIAWVDRKKLPESSFPFKPGDELVKFDGRNPDEVVREVQQAWGNQDTDRAIALLRLTSRSGANGMTIPKGPITITVKPKGEKKEITHELIWDHTPEAVSPTPGLVRKASDHSIDELGSREIPFKWMNNMFIKVDGDEKDKPKPQKPNPFGLGVRESYLPALGVKLPGTETADDNPFHAYLYRSGKHVIGYVRIPSYTPKDAEKAVEAFGKIIKDFEPATDALVIDQLNNPGGSVFYLYTLVSMLSDQALAAPRHKIAITQNDVAEAAKRIRDIEANVKNDEDAKKLLGKTLGGYPVDYEVARHLLEFSRFIVNEWNAGRTLTNPIHLYGADYINPSRVARYTKPILILTNELDFSGGDFFPTILQDNKRATIFGMRTAGAGGFIREVEFPNSVGVSGFSVTGSLAQRTGPNQPIENLGVTPDRQHQLTEDDLRDGFKPYLKAVNAEVEKLIGS